MAALRTFNSVADRQVPRILSFWFDHPDPVTRWFTPSKDLDEDIRSQFGNLVKEARDTPALDTWTQEPDSTLALLLLLDQFPRNIFRGSSEAYQSDAKALSVAVGAVAKSFDHQVSLIRQPFFYLPFMHSETLLGQIAGQALYKNCAVRCGEYAEAKKFVDNSTAWAQQHLDVIQRFGRFPSRNVDMRRESTTEELDFLREHPTGF